MGNSTLKNAWILTKAGLVNAYGLNKLRPGSANHGRAIGIMAVIAVAIAYMMFGLLTFFYLIAESLDSMGQLPVLLSMSVTMGLLVCFIMTCIRGSGFLFNFKDFDMLVSLPVQRQALLLSKIAQLYISLLVFVLLLMTPPTIIFGYVGNMPFYYYILGILMIFLVPVVPIALGCIVAFPISAFAMKWKYSNVIIMVVTFGIIIAYLGFSFSMSFNMQDLSFGKPIADFFNSMTIPLINFYSGGLANLDVISLIIFAAINVAVLYLFTGIFGRAFQSINAMLTEKTAVSNYKMRSLSVSSASKTLYLKELRSYFACNVYVINTGFGMVMLLAYAVLMLVMGPERLTDMLSLPLDGGLPVQLSAAIALFCLAMTCTTASSVSMEGNRLWITKSLPVSAEKVFISKILVNLTVSIPVCAVSAVCFGFGLSFDIISVIGLIAALASFALLIALTGLVMNLLFPKLDWKSPVQAIKQSMSVLAAMGAGFVLAALSIAAYFMLSGSFALASACVAAVSLLLSLAMWLWLKGQGVSMYNRFE